jgi:hypothetical protein
VRRDHSSVHRIAASFTWPFGAQITTWLGGAVAVLLLPVAFVPLLGYAIAVTRAAARDPARRPPARELSTRLLEDGFWTTVAVVLTLAPFAAVFTALTHILDGIGLVAAFFVLAMAWGLVALTILPHATAAFAATGRPRDLFDVAASLRGVRRDFATWNVVCAAMVTAWAIGLACAALVWVGILPGIFYAILVSAHATAALEEARPKTLGERFGDPGGPDSGESPSSGASASVDA